MDLLKLTALELGKKIKAGEVTVREAVRAVIEQAKEVEPAINSYVTLDEEGAYAQAARVSDKTAFFYMGEMVEFDQTKKIFTNPEKEATQNYITGRFG